MVIITHHRDKLTNAIIYFAKNTKYCGKTKLMKLLFFLDFLHFKQTGKSVTGLDYFTWEKGPVPKDLFEELSGNLKPDLEQAINIVRIENFQKIIAKKDFDSKYFTNREKKLLSELSTVFSDAQAEQMVESTHLSNQPWDRTLQEKGLWKKIDYLLAIDGMKDSLPYDEARERMEEISEMEEIFGTK